MILFVDDEPRDMNSFVLELQFDLGQENVTFESNVDKALEYLENHKNEIQIVILDNTMPSGKIYEDEQTHEVIRTGLFLYEDIRSMLPDIPIIIFSNVPKENVLTNYSSDSEKKIMNMLEQETGCNKADYLEKPDYFPYELVEVVKKMLNFE
ncbi:MAG: response regulator [Moorea sp. SIO2B7]|nr:response regulator [Moorena sp. SIO2B7]